MNFKLNAPSRHLGVWEMPAEELGGGTTIAGVGSSKVRLYIKHFLNNPNSLIDLLLRDQQTWREPDDIIMCLLGQQSVVHECLGVFPGRPGLWCKFDRDEKPLSPDKLDKRIIEGG